MIILLKLLMAHLIGDFLLQPGKWVKAKETKKTGCMAIIPALLVTWLAGFIAYVGYQLLDVGITYCICSFDN